MFPAKILAAPNTSATRLNMTKPRSPTLSRRRFLKKSAGGAGLLAAGGAAAALARSLSTRHKTKHNAFAYPLEPQTDPTLLHYRELARFNSPRAEPRRIAVGADERLYLASGNYVSILAANGAVLSEISCSARVRCLAVTTDLIYAGLRDRIEVFDHSGTPRSGWPVTAARSWLTGLAAGRNRIYAADAGNREVLTYDLSGKLVGTTRGQPAERSGPGFVVPSPIFDLAMGGDDLLRVANPGRHQVEIYTTDGAFEFSWGKASARIDGFCGCCNPMSVALLADGRCVTSEKGLPRVKVYTARGDLESVVAGPESFPKILKAVSNPEIDTTENGLDVAVDAQDRIYILDYAAADVRIMARDTPVHKPVA